jgi:inosine-uridine nucleoside N-ribohydrolase
MTGPSTIPIVIDSDCALGSKSGDVDDGFALHYALRKFPISKTYYSAVGGNASATQSFKNILELQKQVNPSAQPCQAGANPKQKLKVQLPSPSFTTLALGPLTNVAHWQEQDRACTDQIWMTLGRILTKGNCPPLWPIEFNATKDFAAFKSVCQSQASIVLTPLDVAYKLRLTQKHWLKMSEQKDFEFLVQNTHRWRTRNLFFKGRQWFPVWDLVSTVAIHKPELFKIEAAEMYVFKNGLVLCDVNGQSQTHHQRDQALFHKKIKAIVDFDADQVWQEFFS